MAEKDSKIDSENELMDPEDSGAGEDSDSSPDNEDSSGTAKYIFWPEEPLYFVPSEDEGDESSKRRASQELHEESLKQLRMKIAAPDSPTLTSARLDLLLSILRGHPLGLNRNSLFRYFRNCFNMNDTSLESLFQESLEQSGGSIVRKTVPGVGELYFRAKNVIDLQEMTSFIANEFLKLTVCGGGKVPARSAVTKVQEICPGSFDVKDWGLEISSFVKIILSISPNGRLHLIPYDCEDQESHPGEDYLFVQGSGIQEVDAIVQAHLEMREIASLPLKPIETSYVKVGEKVDNMGMYITEGLVLECKPFQINSIIDFYVILIEYWNQMECFQTVLNDRYKDGSEFYHGSPPPPLPLKYLVPGTVATCYMEEEWFRVEILAYNPKNSKCKVRSTELGIMNDVEAQDLRMLDREMFKQMPTQAVRCGLRLPEPFSAQASQLFSCGSPESSRSSVLLKEVVSDRCIYVTFRNFVPVHDARYSLRGEEYMWEVDMAVGKREGEFAKCEPDKVDLAEHLIQKFASEPIFNHMFT